MIGWMGFLSMKKEEQQEEDEEEAGDIEKEGGQAPKVGIHIHFIITILKPGEALPETFYIKIFPSPSHSPSSSPPARPP